MMRFILLFTFCSTLFFSTSLICAQSSSGEDELIWIEEEDEYVDDETEELSDSTSVEGEELFDAEEQAKSSALLRFLRIEPQSDTIELAAPNGEPEPEIIKDIPADNNTTRAEKAVVKEEKAAGSSRKSATATVAVKRDSLTNYFANYKLPDYIPPYDGVIVNPIFMPFVFDGKVLLDDYRLYDPELYIKKQPSTGKTAIMAKEDKTTDDDMFETNRIKKVINRNLRNYVALNQPEHIKYCISSMPTDIPVAEVIRKPNLLTRLDVDETLPGVGEGPGQFVQKIKYFIATGSSSLQLSQNYISTNWSAGGNSGFSIDARNEFNFNYDNRKNIKIDNTFYFNQLITSGQADTLRNIKVGNDVARFTTKIRFKAARNWDYTVRAQFETQFLQNYEQNTYNLRSAFLAPFTVTVGPGMLYSYNKQFAGNKYKNLKITVNMAPVSYKYMHTRNPDIDLKRHGFEENKTTLREIGTEIDAAMTFNISRYIQWISKYYLFTNYQSVKTFFENTFDFKVTRHFSTRIYVNMQYDSKITDNKLFGKLPIQINEQLSFGFYYNW